MTKQKMLIYLISIGIVILWVVSLFQLDQSTYDQIMYHDDFMFQYKHLSLEYLNLMMPLLIVMMVMHHESNSLQPLYAFFGKSKVTFYKMLSYVFFILWTQALLIVFIYCLPYLMTSYYLVSLDFLFALVLVFNQNLIVMNLVFMFIHIKYQNFAIIFAVLAIIYHMLIQDKFRLLLFYLCPFYHENMLQYKYHIVYQILYIILGFIIAYNKMVKTQIS
ncbi:MAG: hypothetical protein WCR19_01515 [Acholeplasmataceae bacterium]